MLHSLHNINTYYTLLYLRFQFQSELLPNEPENYWVSCPIRQISFNGITKLATHTQLEHMNIFVLKLQLDKMPFVSNFFHTRYASTSVGFCVFYLLMRETQTVVSNCFHPPNKRAFINYSSISLFIMYGAFYNGTVHFQRSDESF